MIKSVPTWMCILQLSMQKKNKVTKEADAEVEATTKEPKAEAKTKEPPTLKESIDTSVNMTACCAFCSVLCICTIPSLIPVFIAACVLAVVSLLLHSSSIVCCLSV